MRQKNHSRAHLREQRRHWIKRRWRQAKDAMPDGPHPEAIRRGDVEDDFAGWYVRPMGEYARAIHGLPWGCNCWGDAYHERRAREERRWREVERAAWEDGYADRYREDRDPGYALD